jgi:hypothetical protein
MAYLGYPNPRLYTIDSGGALLFHDTYIVQRWLIEQNEFLLSQSLDILHFGSLVQDHTWGISETQHLLLQSLPP